MRLHLRKLALALACIASLALPGAAGAEGAYRLDEGDALRLILPADGAVAGTYRLGEGGRIALPVGEEVPLSGLTIAEATQAVAAALSRRIKDPALALELIERRPFFVTGDVAQPGAYPHRAGLTVATAIALAGGPYRLSSSDLQSAVTGIRAGEDHAGALLQLAAAQLRAARIEAALAGAADFEPPPRPEGIAPAEYDRLAGRERAIARESAETHESRMALLAAQLEELEAQIGRLADSAARADDRLRRIDEAQEERQALVEQGLLTVERQEAAEALRAQAQSGQLQVGVLLSQAQEDRLDLQLQLDEAPRQRRIALLGEAAQTRIEILRLRQSLEASATLIDISGAPGGAGGLAASILRSGGAAAAGAAMTDPVAPGDLLIIRRERDPGRGAE